MSAVSFWMRGRHIALRNRSLVAKMVPRIRGIGKIAPEGVKGFITPSRNDCEGIGEIGEECEWMKWIGNREPGWCLHGSWTQC